MHRIRVLLAEDHRIVSEALASLLKESFDVVGTVRDGRSLVDEATKLRPDVIVSDVFMPVLNGIEAAKQLKSLGITSKVVFLTMRTEARVAAEAFRAGAHGFVSKDSAGDELVQAIQDASKGLAFVTPLVAKEMIKLLLDSPAASAPLQSELTARQREVLQLIAEGRTMKEVASILGISARTAEGHKYEIMQLLGVNSTAQLVQWAIRLGIIAIEEESRSNPTRDVFPP